MLFPNVRCISQLQPQHTKLHIFSFHTGQNPLGQNKKPNTHYIGSLNRARHHLTSPPPKKSNDAALKTQRDIGL